MSVQGHKKVIDSLLKYLPPVALLLGPHSVGRWQVAEHARWKYGIVPSDVLRLRNLDVESVRTLREFSLTVPSSSPFKLAIVDLYKSSVAAQTALLSVLGDPHHLRVIIVGQAKEVTPSIRSLSVVYQMSYLTPEEVAQVLIDSKGMSKDRAVDLAKRSGGQISGALAVADSEDTLEIVRAVILALRLKDSESLSELAKKWTDEATNWLVQWCYETVSGDWRVFDPEDRADSNSLPIRILMVVRPQVRPRLVVRSQLMSLLRGD